MTLVVAIAMIAAIVLTPLAKALAWKFGAVSWPDGNRKLHAGPTALWGGGAVYLGTVLGVTASYQMVPGTFNAMLLLSAVGVSAGMICLLGCYDDRYEMRARSKLLGQILATLPVVLVGCYIKQIVLFGFCIELGWFGILATMGWLVLGINALNLLDGMDGLASTVGIVISVAVGAVSLSHGNPEAILPAAALAGALTGFLVYNLPPARIYLGDCGSMVIGLIVSVLALQVSLVGPMTANLTIASVLLFVPLMDTALAIVRRALQGHGLMVADRGHVHHRLLDRGFSVWQTLFFLGGLCLASGAMAWSTAVSGQELWAWVGLAALTVLLVNRQLLGHVEWNLTRQFMAQTAMRLTRWALPAGWPNRLSLSVPTSAVAVRPEPANGTLQGETLRIAHIPSTVEARVENPKTLPGSPATEDLHTPLRSLRAEEIYTRHESAPVPAGTVKSVTIFATPAAETLREGPHLHLPPHYPVLLLDLKRGMATWARNIEHVEQIVRSA